MGTSARASARRGTPGRDPRGARDRGGGGAPRGRSPHALRLLHRELEKAPVGGSHAHGPAQGVSGQGAADAGGQQHPLPSCWPNLGARARDPGRPGARRRGHQRQHRSHLPDRAQLLRSHRAGRSGSHRRAPRTDRQARRGERRRGVDRRPPRYRWGPRPRPADPHLWGAARLQLPPVADRLRGASTSRRCCGPTSRPAISCLRSPISPAASAATVACSRGAPTNLGRPTSEGRARGYGICTAAGGRGRDRLPARMGLPRAGLGGRDAVRVGAAGVVLSSRPARAPGAHPGDPRGAAAGSVGGRSAPDRGGSRARVAGRCRWCTFSGATRSRAQRRGSRARRSRLSTSW